MAEIELSVQKPGGASKPGDSDEAGDGDVETKIAPAVSTSDSASVAVIPVKGSPTDFQSLSGKDYEKLYGKPDRWACLDTSEVVETGDYLVMKTHPFISKCFGMCVWAVGVCFMATSVWAIYLYINAEQDSSSPRYYQSKLCSAVTILNEDLLNETLQLSCALDVPVINIIGDFFWIIWLVFLVLLTFGGCCAPPDRELVLEKDTDSGYVRERNWNFCSICCARVHCGMSKVVCEFTPTLVYASLETEKRVDGVGGWGITRWGLTNPTKVLVLRDLHDGEMLHMIDAHDIMCCYFPQCCLKETEYYLVTLKQRLESHLRER